MSRKHEAFSIGEPNKTTVLGEGLIEVRDAWGLSNDPKEHADPKCSTCYGRGVYKRVVEVPPCNEYLGDDDATSPQLLCIRNAGHEGGHDQRKGDPPATQLVWEPCGCATKRRDRRRRLLESTGVQPKR